MRQGAASRRSRSDEKHSVTLKPSDARRARRREEKREEDEQEDNVHCNKKQNDAIIRPHS